jgi:dephospho-CoA kinase
VRVFIVVGMPASGKNIARDYAESKSIAYFATGDLVREEIARLGLDPSPDNMAAVSNRLRGADGLGVTRIALTAALASGKGAVFMEGMRSWPEIEIIAAQTDCTVIAFLAPRRTRLERIVSRGRSDDSAEAFAARDQREIDYGASVPIALADEYVLNTGSMKDAMAAIDAIVGKYSGT